ncbi:hypothetical protein H6503_00305 [Candidatus Woesearchaeota archaeon]|nr:hypothetical protein [Candidatus Woesearchaeota archaeon]
MTNITLSLPDEVHAEMRKFSEVRWSEVARKAIIDRLEALKMAEKIAGKSELTSKDVKEFANLIKKKSNKRFLDEAGS